MKRRANPNDIIRKHREQFRGGLVTPHFTSAAEIQVELESDKVVETDGDGTDLARRRTSEEI